MSLIRKPEIEEFRDSATVRTVRGARAVVTVGGSTALRTVRNLWLGGILLVFIATGLGHAGSVNGIIPLIAYLFVMGGAVLLLFRLFRPATRVDKPGFAAPLSVPDYFAGVSVPLPEHLRPDAADSEERFAIDYWPRALGDKIALFVVGGLALAVVSGGICTLVSLFLLVRAALLAKPLRGSRACVRFSPEGLAVSSLWSRETMRWQDIDQVLVERLEWRKLWLWTVTGTRKVVLVQSARNAQAPDLLIAYPLLGLDANGARWLAARIGAEMAARRGTAEPLPAQLAPSPAMPPATVPPTPAVRMLAREIARPAPGHDEPFDADAIMQRYLAERAQVAKASGMTPVRRPAFGRKGVF